ncbi:RHS repeat domain-containing protein [Bergeyella sp. RCAD1439]|uniref:RHS repeat domain-containing protein n=1 Tax=Bergeyella anatis TaxID=3113737 RepID=UPI002E174DDE|nr:RHS repeat-associated core domain-containing protein [Bergeyella sp. RCAD1439]
MHCQTVIKRRNKFRGYIGVLSKRSRTYSEAIRSKKRLPKWQKGKFTKHYFEGTSRIVSKLGEGTFQQPSGLTAGGIDYIKQSAKMQEAIDAYVRGLNVPPGPPTQHGIYGTPDFTGVEYPSIDWSDISQDQEPPEGWPRPPKFNEPGDVPGPPVQYGDPVKPDNVKGGFGYVDNGIEEKNLYYYHPDHLGSSSYITDANGDINQHTEYMAFGEVLFDEHKVSRRMPYLFNGKELDSETGLYYYGARYYDPRVSLWLNVDPLAEKYPSWSPYAYVANNPINAIDPDGRDIIFVTNKGVQLQYRKGNFYFMNGDLKGQRYDGRKHSTGSSTLFLLARAYRAIEKSNDKVLKHQLHTLESSKNIHLIREGRKGMEENNVGTDLPINPNPNKGKSTMNGDPKSTITNYDFSNETKKSFQDTEGIVDSVLGTVTHEMRHQYDYDQGNMMDNLPENSYSDPSEIRAVNNENRGRALEGLAPRKTYNGIKIDEQKLKNPPSSKNK